MLILAGEGNGEGYFNVGMGGIGEEVEGSWERGEIGISGNEP